MATFIDDSTVNEQVFELARFINKLKTSTNKGSDNTTPSETTNEVFYEECVKLTESNQNLQVLIKILDEAKLTFSESEKDVEGFFYVILSIAKKLGKEDTQKVTQKVIEQLTLNPEDKPLLRIRLLINLYNILGPNATERHQVYLEILKFSNTSRNADLVLSQIKESDIDSKIAEWNLDPTKKRQILKQIRDLFATSKSATLFKWSVKYISSFDGNLSNDETNEGLEEAHKVTLEGIKLADVFQLDHLLSVPIIKKMENHTKYGSTFKFLKIFVGENFDAYKAFVDQNSNFIASNGLNADDCLRKIRLLSLATLASNNTELPYSLIIKTLNINENEVELWVITAISENLIAGKMDQLKRIVLISRALQRTFDKAQWKSISDSLTIWKGNVKVMLNTLNETKKLKSNQQINALSKAIQQN